MSISSHSIFTRQIQFHWAEDKGTLWYSKWALHVCNMLKMVMPISETKNLMSIFGSVSLCLLLLFMQRKPHLLTDRNSQQKSTTLNIQFKLKRTHTHTHTQFPFDDLCNANYYYSIDFPFRLQIHIYLTGFDVLLLQRNCVFALILRGM